MKPFNWWIQAIWIAAMILSLGEEPAANPKVASPQPDALVQDKVQAAYGRLPLAFEVNQGQVDKEVKFLSRGRGYSLSMTSTEAVLQLVNPENRLPTSERKSSDQQVKITNRHSFTLHFKLVGSSSAPQIDGLDPLPGKSNYLTTNDPAKWRTNIPNYSKVRYKDVYPGIDLIYYGNQRQLEYDFVVAPGADPKVVTLSFEGIVDSRSVALRIDNNGDLVLDAIKLRQHKPVVYQEVDGMRQPITCRYVLKGGQRVGFELGAYDPNRPFVIDPVLSYSTTGLGGSAIAVDSLGNAYLTGDPGFQGVLGSLCGTAPNTFPCYDVFVAKLNPSGTELIYSTYFGGSDVDYGTAIAVDHAGNAYLAGVTSSANFPTTPDAFQTTGGGAGVLGPSYDVFVAKLNSTGTALAYSTYLGGSANELVSGIALDSAGNAYVTGVTFSMDFPTTPGAFQTTAGTTRSDGYTQDAFVARLNSLGTRLLYSTYLGGSGLDWGVAIALDSAGNAYVAGSTSSTDFPTSPGAFETTWRSCLPSNAFLTKLDRTGTSVVYATYLCGVYVTDIAVDSAGNAYVTGVASSDLRTTSGAFQTTCRSLFGRPFDAFVIKLNSTGTAPVYSTYLGGGYYDAGSAIAVDSAGHAYVTGHTTAPDFATYSPDFPTTPGAFQPGSGIDYDYDEVAFVTKLNAAGTELVYSTYLENSLGGNDTAVDSAGNVYVTGWANSSFLRTPQAIRLDADTGRPVRSFVTKLFDELSLFVPLVLSFSGVNHTLFTSELTLTNRAARDVTLNFTYTAIVGDGSGTASDTLLAGRQRIIPDAIAYLRSLGIPIPASGNCGGSLVVRFSGLSSSSEGSVLVRTTTPVPEGRAGLAYAGIPTSATLSGPAYLCGLRQNATDRTNVAIHNTGAPSEGMIILRVTVFSGNLIPRREVIPRRETLEEIVDGSSQLKTRPLSYTLPDVTLFPGGFLQINNILRSNGLSLSSGYVRVERVSGTAPYYAFAFIHDQTNSDGVVIGPVPESSLVGNTGLTLPVIVETSTFSSELVLTNWSASKKSVRFAYVDGIRAQGSSANFVIELNAGEQMILPNFVHWLRERGVSGLGSLRGPHVGPLYATVEGGDANGIFLGVRTSRLGELGRYSVFYAGVPHSMANTSSTWLYGLQQNAENRTNVALVNIGGTDSAPNTFTVEIFDGETGLKVNTIEAVTLKPRDWMQFESILAGYAGGITQAYARVTRTGGSNAFITYAIISDGSHPGERSGDAAFVSSSP